MASIQVPRPHQARRRAFTFEGSGDVNPWASDVDQTLTQIIKSLGQSQRLFAQLTNQTSAATGHVALHASTHLPNGTDPLTTAAPSSVLGGTSSNQKGTGNSYARSDHSHDVGTAAHTGGYGTTAVEGAGNPLLRADAQLKYPAALMSLANSATFTMTDDATDMTWTGSLGALNIRPAGFTLSLPRWTAGGAGAPQVGTILAFSAFTSVLPGLTTGISASLLIDDASNGNFYGVRLNCGPSAAASGLSAANFRHLDFSPTASINLGGTQTIANRLYIDFSIPRLIGGTNTVVTDTGLMQSGAWPAVGVTAGAWTNAYIAKLGFPTVGGTIRRGLWFTTITGNIGTEAASTEGIYWEALKRGTTNRRTYAFEGATTGTPTAVYGLHQLSAHAVGTDRWGAKLSNKIENDATDFIASASAKGLIVMCSDDNTQFVRIRALYNGGAPSVTLDTVGTALPTQ
jgi:hypothetical protein